MVRNHGCAGTRRHHDVFRALECLGGMPGHRGGLLAVPRVEGWLSAAGLAFRKDDFIAKALQHLGHGHPGAGVKPIDDAGDEDRDSHAEPFPLPEHLPINPRLRPKRDFFPMLSSTIVKTLKLSVLLAISAAAFGAEDRVVLTTMSEELQRNFQALKEKADPAPYFLSYEITDQETHVVGATLGELNSEGNSHARYLDVTVRVGDPKLDNFRRVRGERIQFTSGEPVAIEDVPSR